MGGRRNNVWGWGGSNGGLGGGSNGGLGGGCKGVGIADTARGTPHGVTSTFLCFFGQTTVLPFVCSDA